jgi:hypothetical protein
MQFYFLFYLAQAPEHTNQYTYNMNPSSEVPMPFSVHPAMFVQPIQGEFTRLLLEAHGDATPTPLARRLDFHEGTSSSRFDG